MILSFVYTDNGKLETLTWEDGRFKLDNPKLTTIMEIFQAWEGVRIAEPTFPSSIRNHVQNWFAVVYILEHMLEVVSVSGIPEADPNVVY